MTIREAVATSPQLTPEDVGMRRYENVLPKGREEG